jgi:hypothetical protein
MRLDRCSAAAGAALCAVLVLVPAAWAQLKLPRVSPKASVSQTIAMTDVTVSYSRPGVKGRVIWGGVVPYDAPWRTGANEATTVAVSDTVTVGGQKLPTGTYSFFTIPGRDEWTVVFSKQKDLWGAYDYKPEEDALRVKVKPQTAPHQEWMGFTFENLKPASGDLVLRWEKLMLAVPFAVDDVDQALVQARTEIANAKPDDYRTSYRAADFFFSAGLVPDETEAWVKKSMAVQENYYNLGLYARMLEKAGKRKEAVATAEKAIAAGKASKDRVDTHPIEAVLAEWKSKP